MGDAGHEPSTIKIHSALNALLLEPEMQALLTQHHILTQKVHVPEGQTQPEIVQNILTLLDSADLAVFDLTPKASNPDRANVFYELALVHSLGIPALLVVQDGHDVPFYAQTTMQYRVADFEPATLANALRAVQIDRETIGVRGADSFGNNHRRIARSIFRHPHVRCV